MAEQPPQTIRPKFIQLSKIRNGAQHQERHIPSGLIVKPSSILEECVAGGTRLNESVLYVQFIHPILPGWECFGSTVIYSTAAMQELIEKTNCFSSLAPVANWQYGFPLFPDRGALCPGVEMKDRSGCKPFDVLFLHNPVAWDDYIQSQFKTGEEKDTQAEMKREQREKRMRFALRQAFRLFLQYISVRTYRWVFVSMDALLISSSSLETTDLMMSSLHVWQEYKSAVLEEIRQPDKETQLYFTHSPPQQTAIESNFQTMLQQLNALRLAPSLSGKNVIILSHRTLRPRTMTSLRKSSRKPARQAPVLSEEAKSLAADSNVSLQSPLEGKSI